MYRQFSSYSRLSLLPLQFLRHYLKPFENLIITFFIRWYHLQQANCDLAQSILTIGSRNMLHSKAIGFKTMPNFLPRYLGLEKVFLSSRTWVGGKVTFLYDCLTCPLPPWIKSQFPVGHITLGWFLNLTNPVIKLSMVQWNFGVQKVKQKQCSSKKYLHGS